MTDYTRLVFDRLYAAGAPDAAERADIYARCRDEVDQAYADAAARARAREALEKAIRRQEMQALYEDSFDPSRTPRKAKGDIA